MNFSDEMKKLGDNIASSYDIRVSALGDIIKDTQSTLKDARTTVRDFHTDRMHKSEELRGELEGFKSEMTEAVEKMLHGFHKDHSETANALRANLSKFCGDIRKDVGEIKRNSQKMLVDFRNSFEEMSQALHKMLSGYYKDDVQKPVRDMLSTFHGHMKALAGDFEKAHEAWMSVSRSISAKKGKKHAEEGREEKFEKICSALQNHPKGMTLAMFAKELGCPPQSLRGPLEKLKKEGQVGKKKDKFFFKK